jgi:hypothetical protein
MIFGLEKRYSDTLLTQLVNANRSTDDGST